MNPIRNSETQDELSVSLTAAVLLAAVPKLKALGLPHPSSSEVLAALGAKRTQAYELKARLEASLPRLHKPAGRPKNAPPEPLPDLTREVLLHLIEHPGAARHHGHRRSYSDSFRIFILDQLCTHKEHSLESFADASTVPLGTLKDWLRGGAIGVEFDKKTAPQRPDPKGPQLKTLVAEWERWEGSFTGFCDHLQEHCRIPWGRTHVQTVLGSLGLRRPRRRPGRSSTERAIRGLFTTYFPHAQWEGDGTKLPVLVDGQLFVFNLELNVDAYSGAFVGAALTPTEDAKAVIATFRDAINATGVQPLSLLLDNKPSNHCAAVEEAMPGTLLTRSTPYRGQSKPHIEGGFGLLKPNLKGIELDTSGTREQLAASYARGLIAAVLRTLNHRPRHDRKGLSRAELLDQTPTEEEVKAAHRELVELQAKQEKQRKTLIAQQNPEVRSRLAAAFERLGLDDPHGHLLTTTARHPLDVIVEAIAIFESHKKRGTLPPGVDARYLLGIANNLAIEWQSLELAECLWNERVAAGDEHTRRLEQTRRDLVNQLSDPNALIKDVVERAVTQSSRLDRHFWLTAAANVITDQDASDHQRLFRLTTQRIAATYTLSSRARDAAIRFLAAQVKPLR